MLFQSINIMTKETLAKTPKNLYNIGNCYLHPYLMQSEQIRQKFLDFFEKRGHVIVPSSSLVPENDPSVLFNTAGMQPLVPYLMGLPHPSGKKRIANAQKCVRTNDIEEVGDNTHLTFFEMLGNWSLGDYFKKEAIQWSFEFLTSKEEGLGLDPLRLYVTVFEGDENAPRDEEAYTIWKGIFETIGLDPEKRIFFMDADSNWWSPGDNGPCGPDSEMFYDLTGKLTEGLTKGEFIAADGRQDVVEIWNDVFMEYEKKDGKITGKLQNQNVDTGSGLERVTTVVQGQRSVFDTDLFAPILEKISSISKTDEGLSKRVIADHMRASMFLIADGVTPSNTDQGYILRRLLRRAVRHADKLGMPNGSLTTLVETIVSKYGNAYPNLKEKQAHIEQEVSLEETKFRKTLEKGIKEFDKLSVKDISGHDAFMLFSTYGFPIELTLELAKEKGVNVNKEEFEKEMEKHQELSRTSSAGKFKGGLANTSEITTMLHTTTHLMLAGLRKYLDQSIHQAGSNITEERTRFDFTYPTKVERDVLDKVEAYVNEAIAKKADVIIEVMDKQEALKRGVEGSFWEKYPDKVTVYTIKGSDGTVYSQELCGGPHVTNTGDIKGTFKITKEEASSAGVRRIKGILE
jgi:alanyl-tRNA synthetase